MSKVQGNAGVLCILSRLPVIVTVASSTWRGISHKAILCSPLVAFDSSMRNLALLELGCAWPAGGSKYMSVAINSGARRLFMSFIRALLLTNCGQSLSIIH